MAVSCRRVIDALQSLYPSHLALHGDPTGLQVGTARKDVDRVLCTLDLTLEVAQEARDLRAGLVVSHHAVVFRPLEHLRTDTQVGRILETLIKADVAVYVPHTALDVAPDGTNDDLARRLGLSGVRPIEETGHDEAVLLMAKRPAGDVDSVERILFTEGATRVDIVGHHVEVLAPRRRLAGVSARLGLLVGEEPRAIPLLSSGSPRGIGRVGELGQPLTIGELARAVRDALEAPHVRVVSRDPGAKVERVGVLAGDGRRYVDAAAAAGAQALVTGDVDHHTALRALARGVALIDAGHWATERRAPELVAEGLRVMLADEPVEVLVSRVSTQPFSSVAPSPA